MKRLGRALLDYLRHAGLFLLASTGIAAVVTVVLPLVGYATFGDRPGPGWYGVPRAISWSEIGQLASYAAALPMFGAGLALIYFVIPYALTRLLQRMHAPDPVIRLVAGLACMVVAAIVVAAAGWYIALGAVAGGAGIVGGLLYGAMYLARRAPERGEPAPGVT